MKLKSIRTRISLLGGACLLIAVTVIIAYSALVMKQNAKTARREAIDIATKYALAQAKQQASRIRVELETALDTARTLAHTLAAIKDDTFDIEIGRDEVSGILRNILEKNPQFYGVYTAWEPDAFDQMDIGFARTQGHDASGRFIPHWVRGANERLLLEPLTRYEEEGKGNYYLLPKNTKRECIIDPYPYSKQGKPRLMTALTMPIIVNDTFLGVVGINLQLERFQRLVDGVRNFYEGTAKILLISHNGTLVAVTNRPELIGKQFKQLHENSEDNIDAIQNGRVLIDMEGNLLEIFVPVNIGRTATPWSVNIILSMGRVTADADEQLRQADYEMMKMIGISLLCAGAALAVLWIVAGSVVTPLLKSVAFAKSVATGDLSATIDVEQKDEIGTLASALKNMAGDLNALVRQIQQSGIQVTSSATELVAMVRQQDATVKVQMDSTNEVLKSVEEITDITSELVNTMQEVASMSTETAGFANSGRTGLAHMEEAMHSMESASKSISAKLGTINEKTGNITTVVTTMTNVADQTNLLSLNAAIEAEKAGESGRGFTVVAREIRRLADQTAVATLDIDQMVQEMQSSVTKGVMEMDKFIVETQCRTEDVKKISLHLTRIIEQVQTLSPDFENINAAMGHQSENAQKINQAMTSLRDETRQTAESLGETYAAVKQLNETARGLQHEVSRFKVK